MSIEMYGWEPTFELLVKPILKHVCMRWHQTEKEGWSLLSSMCAAVFLNQKPHQHHDVKIVKVYYCDMSMEMCLFQPTFELLVKPILNLVCICWHQLLKVGWPLLSSMCAVVF